MHGFELTLWLKRKSMPRFPPKISFGRGIGKVLGVKVCDDNRQLQQQQQLWVCQIEFTKSIHHLSSKTRNKIVHHSELLLLSSLSP
jgi:hypothetical protein